MPEADWDQLFHWSEAMVGAGDPDYQLEGEGFQTTFMRNAMAMEEYFCNLIRERMKDPAAGVPLTMRIKPKCPHERSVAQLVGVGRRARGLVAASDVRRL